MRVTGQNRGVLYPARLPTFHRLPPPPACQDLVRWFWLVEWDVEPGRTSRQHVLAYPASNLVVEQHRVGFAGPTTRASHRDLTGRGWAVAALLRPAAVPTFTDDPTSVRDAYLTLDLPDVHDLLGAVTAAMSAPGAERRRAAAADALATWLAAAVGPVDAEARLANAMAELVETGPDVTRVDDLASRLHVSPRTLQRLARKYVGLPPGAMIRRRRLQEAAERLRSPASDDLAAVAGDVGYADHAHLTGDFRTAVGLTPSRYRDQVADPDG